LIDSDLARSPKG